MDGKKPTRRQLLGGLAAAGVAVCCGDHAELLGGPVGAAAEPVPAALSVEVAPGLRIHRRDAWGADLPPRGTLRREQVEFLLVHHTASSNSLTDARSVIRATYHFHTGPQKRWPDVCYNFFVGPDGSVWEGRAGSLDGPIVADATGGNQGFSQLVCLIGNFVSVPPTAAAQASLVRVLAWLSNRDGISTWRDASATFVSRGSNKFPAGSVITTPAISPHRAVTYTACPGDAAVALLPTWRRRVHEVAREAWRTDGLQRARRTNLVAP